MNAYEREQFENICRSMIIAIDNTYRSFGVRIKFTGIEIDEMSLVFGITPGYGVRVKTVMSYEKDISLRLGTDAKIKLVSAKGYIGIFVPLSIIMNKIGILDKKEDKVLEEKRKVRDIQENCEEVDELFEKAGRLILDKERASIGMLQRALQIGFNRAARIMDNLCQYGVVGEEEGMNPRKILMGRDGFEKLLEKLRDKN